MVRNEFSYVPENVAEYVDLVQIGVLGLMHAAANWDHTRGVPFKTYCYRRVKGMIQDWLEKNWRHVQNMEGDNYDFPDLRTPHHYMSKKESLLILYSYLEKLPASEQRVIHLHYYCGLTGKQIAFRLHCGESTVSMQLRRAKIRLKKILEDRGITSIECLRLRPEERTFIKLKEDHHG